MILTLYTNGGAKRMEIIPSASDRCVEKLMGDSYLSLSCTHYEYIKLEVGDYVEWQGQRYQLLESYRPEAISTSEYHYSLRLYSYTGYLRHAKVLKPSQETAELDFALDARPDEHIQLIVDNANRITGTKDWTVGTVIKGESRNIEYRNKYCLDALADIAKEYDTEWWIEGRTINLCRCEHGTPIQLGYKKGLATGISRLQNTTAKHFTRLYPLGSKRNINPADYGHSRLQLPNGQSFLERNIHLGIIEQSEETAFSNIYPRYSGTITEVRQEQRTDGAGKNYPIYYIKDSNLPFSPDQHMISGLVIHLVWQTGELNGRDFEANWHPNTKEFEIIAQRPYENLVIPSGNLIPKVGDKYIPYNMRMPQEYVQRAEVELEQAAQKHLEHISKDTSVYKAHTDYIYLFDKRIDLKIGQRVLLKDNLLFADSSGQHASRVTSISRSVLLPTDMDLEFAYSVDFGRIAQLESGVQDLRAAYQQTQATLPTILKSWDSMNPSEYNVFSALRTLRTAIRKDVDDYTEHVLGSRGVVPGSYGWLLKPNGDGYMRNLKIAGALEVDEFRRNRITILEGEHYFSSGNAIVKEVNVNEGYFVDTSEDGDHTSLQQGDYCLGKWVENNGSMALSKIKITRITDGRVYYALALGTKIHPCIGMHIAQVGHENNARRQRATVIRNNTIIQYAKLKGWDIEPKHITGLYGDLDDFVLPSFGALHGSGLMTNNAYISGRLLLQSADGESTKPIGYDKGQWHNGAVAYPHDKYIYRERVWMWMGDGATTSPPSEQNGWVDMGITAEQAARDAAEQEVARANEGLSAELRKLINEAEGRGRKYTDDELLQISSSLKSLIERYESNLSVSIEDKARELLAQLAAYENKLIGDVANLQKQIDGQTERFFGSEIASQGTPPTNLWPRTEDAKHEGDTYTCVAPKGVTITISNASQYPNVGKSWRWTGRDGRYGWELIADTDITRALAIASQAQAAADGKVSHYYQAAPPDTYQRGDLCTLTANWRGHAEGSILTATQDSPGYYRPHDWVEAVRYAKDLKVLLDRVMDQEDSLNQTKDKAQEAAKAAARLDYLRTALIQGSTTIQRGLTIGDIICIKNKAGDIVGYLNGLVNRHNDPMLALGVENFGKGTESAAIEMFPHGDAKFGLMRVVQTPFGPQILFTDTNDADKHILKMGTNIPMPDMNKLRQLKKHVAVLVAQDSNLRRIRLGRKSITGELIQSSNFVVFVDKYSLSERSIHLAPGLVLNITGVFRIRVSTQHTQGIISGWVAVTVVNREEGSYKPYKIPYLIDLSETNTTTIQIKLDYDAKDEGDYYVNTSVIIDSENQSGVDGYADVYVEQLGKLFTRAVCPGTLTMSNGGMGFASSTDHVLGINTDPDRPLIEGRGKLNLPGILLAGRVELQGETPVVKGLWGHYARNVNTTAYRYSGSLMCYEIYHTIGHTDYSVQLTSDKEDCTISYFSIGKEHFSVRQNIGQHGIRQIESGFSFMCIGVNSL
ncbi:MAG: hypothetical protein SPI72_03275 [Porphyromonas sp.]|nr:hypothetical protein [Porphyromonas sp.]